jgi:Ca2+-binding RTX toxin-like protein
MATILNFSTANVGNGYTLAAGESVTLLPGFYVTSSGSNGLDAQLGSNRINVFGTVAAGSIGVQLGQLGVVDGNGINYLSIGTTGVVTGFTGIEVSGVSNTVANAGFISGDGIGIAGGFFDSNLPTLASVNNTGTITGSKNGIRFTNADQTSVTNSGTITNSGSTGGGSSAGGLGDLLGAVAIGGNAVHITNSGAITGTSGIGFSGTFTGAYGVGVFGNGTVVINSGTIATDSMDATRAAVDLITLTGETATLRNTGLITSGATAVEGGVGNETIINGGTISGDVVLGDGNDIYDGRLGRILGDVIGGQGNDTFIISDAATNIVELAGGGTDTVRSTVSYALASTLDNLALLGSADLIGRGNDVVNNIVGNDGDNKLFGFAGNDFLRGGVGDDFLDGGLGVDTVGYGDKALAVVVTLNGATSANVTVGGVIEDTVVNIENINGGLAGDTLTGDGFANSFFGNAGNDLINGKLGNDILTGSTGLDIFRFDTALGATNNDTITDFSVPDDTFQLENAIFTLLTKAGVNLASDQFRDLSLGAQDATDVIIYNKTTGNLFYDSNGLTAGGQTQFAHITNGTALTNLDFFIT